MSRIKHILNQMKFCLGGTHPIAGPVKVFWEITHRCNSRCINCDMWQKKALPEMNTQQALSVVRQIKDVGAHHLSISGGETFLRKDVFEILAAAKNEGIRISINTNALLLNEEKIRRLCNLGIESTYLSLDGATAETNEAIRGVRDGFLQVIEAIDLFKKCSHGNGSKVFINTTINHLNAHELEAIAELVSKSGADGWTMSVVQNVDIYKPKPEVLLSESDINETERALSEISRRYPGLLPHMSEYFTNFRNSALHPCRLYKYRCAAGFLTVMIHPNGDVYPCPVAFEKAGNVLEKPLNEIWYYDMQKVREKIKKGKHPICWFDCIAPINILMSYASPLKWYRFFQPSFIKHLIHKSM